MYVFLSSVSFFLPFVFFLYHSFLFLVYRMANGQQDPRGSAPKARRTDMASAGMDRGTVPYTNIPKGTLAGGNGFEMYLYI